MCHVYFDNFHFCTWICVPIYFVSILCGLRKFNTYVLFTFPYMFDYYFYEYFYRISYKTIRNISNLISNSILEVDEMIFYTWPTKKIDEIIQGNILHTFLHHLAENFHVHGSNRRTQCEIKNLFVDGIWQKVWCNAPRERPRCPFIWMCDDMFAEREVPLCKLCSYFKNLWTIVWKWKK